MGGAVPENEQAHSDTDQLINQRQPQEEESAEDNQDDKRLQEEKKEEKSAEDNQDDKLLQEEKKELPYLSQNFDPGKSNHLPALPVVVSPRNVSSGRKKKTRKKIKSPAPEVALPKLPTLDGVEGTDPWKKTSF